MAKSDKLFVTEAECAERIGVSTEEFKRLLPGIERDGFPTRDPVFCNRRYWPAVQSFLDQRYGLAPSSMQGIPALDGVEPWNQKK